MKSKVKKLPAYLALVGLLMGLTVLPGAAMAAEDSTNDGWGDAKYVDAMQSVSSEFDKYSKAAYGFIGATAVLGMSKRVK